VTATAALRLSESLATDIGHVRLNGLALTTKRRIGFMRDGRRLRDGREKADDKRLYRDRPR
jgi:hypothetical protein